MPIDQSGTISRLRTVCLARRTARRLALAAALGALVLVPPQGHAQAPRPRVKLRAYPVDVALDTLIFARDTVRASMGETFAAVRAVYTDLKLPREWADSVNGQLGSLRVRATSQLGGERLSVYFNCGQGMTGAHADTWRLSIALVTFLQPAGEGRMRLGTGVVAQAQDMDGASKDPAMCGSSGLLEARILRMVRAKLGQD